MSRDTEVRIIIEKKSLLVSVYIVLERCISIVLIQYNWGGISVCVGFCKGGNFGDEVPGDLAHVAVEFVTPEFRGADRDPLGGVIRDLHD